MGQTDLDERRRRLSARQQSILEERIMGIRSSAAPVLEKRGHSRCRASHGQERIWFLDQLGISGRAYIMPFAAELEGPLDVGALELTFREIVLRHEVLRTRFELEDGGAMQVIDQHVQFRLERLDISGLPRDQRETEVRRLMEEQISKPFDLARGPLFRAKLIRTGETIHVVLVSMHHIVSDGWSVRVLMREVGQLYASFCSASSPSLPELPIQYADYALWQRSWVAGQETIRQIEYWKERLRGSPAGLNLPTDRIRRSTASADGDAVALALPPSLSAKLTDLARQENATSFMLLLAAYQVLLQRYSGQDDIVVGTPIAGRTRPEIRHLIGFFVNTLVMRTDLSGDPSFRELLGRVRRTALDAYAHQDLPFERLVEELQPVRDLSRQSIFQVAFIMENFPDETLVLPGLRVRRIQNERRTAKCDLSLYVYERGRTHEVCFEYANEIFDRSSIEQLSRHWLVLLERLVAQPDAALSTISMLSDEEQAARKWVGLDQIELGPERAGEIAKSSCLVECFLAQVRAAPDKLAVLSAGETWSYEELNLHASRAAALLQQPGREVNEPIGLLFPHEPSMVAAILGALGTGRFYVPLSPLDPPERLRIILAESGCWNVLASPKLRGLAGQLGVNTLFFEGGSETSVELHSRSPGTVAYVLYTSGTTGVPKGVAQCDRAVLQHIAVYSAALAITSRDRITLFARYGTDAAVKNIFGALLNGAALCLWDIREDGGDGLLQWLTQTGVTIWHSTPSLLRATMPQLGGSADLRWVVLGGEAARPGDITIVQQHGGAGCRLLTALSQTECSTGTHYVPDFEQDAGRSRLPVGRPVPGADVVLLDQLGRCSDVRGEVAIGGKGIALGYWRQPELTAERFVPHPLRFGERLYRTGDLARWRSDGELEYIGRVDHQVKIRGHSVSPAEIETALLAIDNIAQAVVIARHGTSEDPRLVAYVVGHESAIVEATALRSALRQRLPDYMVPSAFVVLAEFPLTAGRKVDRNALPEPKQDDTHRGGHEAARTPTEEALLALFVDLLQVPCAGLHDNFFDLGGHSLLATRVATRVREQFGIEMPLRMLFEMPTVAELGDWIDTVQWARQSSILSRDDDLDEAVEQGVL